MKAIMPPVSGSVPLAAFTCGLLLLASADAATLAAVSWGGDYVDADVAFADDTPANRSSSDKYGDPDGPFAINTNDSVAGRALSLDIPLNPSTGYGGTGLSGTFYGGGSVTRENSGTTNDGFSELSILNQGPNDSIHWHVDTGGDSHTFHLALFWNKADFLGSLSTTTDLNLSQGSFSLSTAQVSANHTDELLHWIVRDGTQFFISQDTITLGNNADYVVPYSNLTNWAAYDPTDPSGTATSTDLLSLDFNEAGPFAPHDFTDVTGLGFYVEHEAATGPIHVHIEAFGATLVPEPSAAVLVLFTLTVFGLARRRV
jgi:hypothetical protein